MSLEIFNRAKKMADKIIEINRLYELCKDRLEKTSIGINSYRFYPNTVYVNHGRCTWVLLRHGAEPYAGNDHYKFDGSGTDYRHPKITKPLRRISEFEEDFDFQLSTLFTDTELMDYYFCSLIYSSGYIGFIRRGIHHNSINAILKHVELICRNKDRTSYPYTRSTW